MPPPRAPELLGLLGQLAYSPSVQPSQPESPIAVFVDVENVTGWLVTGGLGALATFLGERYGRITYRRAYARWSAQGLSVQRRVSTAGYEMVHVYHPVAGKNSADIQIVVDVMDLLDQRPEIQCIVLITGDSDFSPLFRRLRERGKQVIGVGPESALSESIVTSCDHFEYIDDSGRTPGLGYQGGPRGAAPVELRDPLDAPSPSRGRRSRSRSRRGGGRDRLDTPSMAPARVLSTPPPPAGRPATLGNGAPGYGTSGMPLVRTSLATLGNGAPRSPAADGGGLDGVGAPLAKSAPAASGAAPAQSTSNGTAARPAPGRDDPARPAPAPLGAAAAPRNAAPPAAPRFELGSAPGLESALAVLRRSPTPMLASVLRQRAQSLDPRLEALTAADLLDHLRALPHRCTVTPSGDGGWWIEAVDEDLPRVGGRSTSTPAPSTPSSAARPATPSGAAAPALPSAPTPIRPTPSPAPLLSSLPARAPTLSEPPALRGSGAPEASSHRYAAFLKQQRWLKLPTEHLMAALETMDGAEPASLPQLQAAVATKLGAPTDPATESAKRAADVVAMLTKIGAIRVAFSGDGASRVERGPAGMSRHALIDAHDGTVLARIRQACWRRDTPFEPALTREFLLGPADQARIDQLLDAYLTGASRTGADEQPSLPLFP